MKKHLLTVFLFCSLYIVHAQAPAFQWVNQSGGSSYDSGNALAVDASGNVYTAGYFATVVDFDPGPGTTSLSGAGRYDA